MEEYVEKNVHELCKEYVKEYKDWSIGNKNYISNWNSIIKKWEIDAKNNENILNKLEEKKLHKQRQIEEKIWGENLNQEILKRVGNLSGILVAFVTLILLIIIVNVTNLFRPLALSTSFRIGIWVTFFVVAVIMFFVINMVVKKVLNNKTVRLWKYRGKRVEVKVSIIGALIVSLIVLLIAFFYIAINWGLWGDNLPYKGGYLEKWSEFGICLVVGIIGGAIAYLVCCKKEIRFEKIRLLLVKDDEENLIRKKIEDAKKQIEAEYSKDKQKLEKAGNTNVDSLHKKLQKIKEQLTEQPTVKQMNAMLSEKLYLAEWDKILEEKEDQNADWRLYEVEDIDWKKGPVVFLHTWENRSKSDDTIDRLLPAVCSSCHYFNAINLWKTSYIDYQSDWRKVHLKFKNINNADRKGDESTFVKELLKQKTDIQACMDELQINSQSYIDQYNVKELNGEEHYKENQIIHFIIPDTSTGNIFSWNDKWWDVLTDCITYGIFPFFYVEKSVWEDKNSTFVTKFREKFKAEECSIYEVNLVDDSLNVNEVTE